MRVLAAVDGTRASVGVLRVAKEVGRVLGAGVDAVHVADGGAVDDAEMLVLDAGLTVRRLDGPVASALVSEAGRDDVEVVVVGLRRTIGTSRPVGHVALQVIDLTEAIVVAVPAITPVGYELRKVLVPIQGRPAAALQRVVAVARDADLDLVVLHVHDESSIPAFEDRPHYDVETWANEFLARWVPGANHDTVMEVRVGAVEEEIVRVCRECRADMIAMGWDRQLPEGRMKAVQSALERSPVPVALLPVRVPAAAPSRA
jgi:hypothetical protein